MRIGLGYLLQETNCFSPVPTTLEDFHLLTGGAVLGRWASTRTEIGAFLDVLASSGHEAVPLFAGWAMTAGPVVGSDYAELKSLALAQASTKGPFDAMLMALHGAMCAEEVDDCEGDLLTGIRAIVGREIPLVLTLDLHANVTAKMVELCDAVIGYKTWPHEDMYETGEQGARLLLEILGGRLRPAVALEKLPLILPAEKMNTSSAPMKEVFDAGEAYRETRAEILAVSAFGVQPWLDVTEMGCATVVVADRARDAAQECARRMAQRFWELREAFEVQLMDPAAAIREALATQGSPVVLAEPTDGPTAGSPGDSAELLRAIIQHAPQSSCLVWIRDPAAVEAASQAGPGGKIRTTVGGAFDRHNHQPLPIEAEVRSLSDGQFRFRGSYNHGMLNEMGRTAVLQAGPASIVVSEHAASNIDPELYRSQGLDPEDYALVVVKSAGSFRPQYEPFSAKILLVETPGVCTPKLRTVPYRRVPRPIHPLDEMTAWRR